MLWLPRRLVSGLQQRFSLDLQLRPHLLPEVGIQGVTSFVVGNYTGRARPLKLVAALTSDRRLNKPRSSSTFAT